MEAVTAQPVKANAESAAEAKPAGKAAPATTAAEKSAPKSAAPKPKADAEAIRARAHAIWVEEGRPHGRDEDHWHRARRELDGE